MKRIYCFDKLPGAFFTDSNCSYCADPVKTGASFFFNTYFNIRGRGLVKFPKTDHIFSTGRLIVLIIAKDAIFKSS